MENTKRKTAVYMRVHGGTTRYSEEGNKLHYQHFFECHRNLEWAYTFVDYGKANPMLGKNPGLCMMLDACKKGDIDLVVIDSYQDISTFPSRAMEIAKEQLSLPSPVEFFFEIEDVWSRDNCFEDYMGFETMMQDALIKRKQRRNAETRRINAILKSPN